MRSSNFADGASKGWRNTFGRKASPTADDHGIAVALTVVMIVTAAAVAMGRAVVGGPLALPHARNLVLNNHFRFVHTWQHGHPEPDQAHPLSA